MSARFIIGDTRAVVASLPDASVDLVLSSPPFLALRSYLPADHPDKELEIGSESGPAEFVDTLLELSAEWRRILTAHGSLAIELGDTYSGSGGAGGDYGPVGMRDGQAKVDGPAARTRSNRPGQYGTDSGPPRRVIDDAWPLAKCLSLIPEAYRLGLAYGRNPISGAESPAGRWRVRNVVRWVRPNPPVGALGDKFRPATSDLVIACTSGQRWFDLDAVRVPNERVDEMHRVGKHSNPTRGNGGDAANGPDHVKAQNPTGAPPLDWWSISPSGFQGSHYATFPAELCIRPIEAMCPRRVCRTCGEPSRRMTDAEYVNPRTGKPSTTLDMRDGERVADGVRNFVTGADNGATKISTTTGWSSCGCPGTDGIALDGFHTGTGWRPGVVLDPFAGTATTLQVAHGRARDCIGIDLDARNADHAIERLGMFLDVETFAPRAVTTTERTAS